jgi:hypothetical protein
MVFLGCGAEIPEAYPVKGKVLHKGVPAAGALIILHPEGETANNPIIQQYGYPRGEVRDDGTFEISTWGASDGAPTGQYSVCITWPVLSDSNGGRATKAEIHPDRFQGALNDPKTSKFKVSVDKTPVDIPSYEL